MNFFIRQLEKTAPPKLLLDRYKLEMRAFDFPPHHFLYDVLNRKLLQYIEADLINYNMREFREASNPLKFQQDEEPFAVLTLGELEAGFVVCILPLILSVFVFGFEWIPTLKDLMLFLFIFKTYFELKWQEQSEHIDLMRSKFAAWQGIIQAENEYLPRKHSGPKQKWKQMY